MNVDEKSLREIVRRVLSVVRPAKIILFGSAATSQLTEGSDVDLLIVEADTSNQRSEYLAISKALWGLPYPFDIVFIAADWFERSKNVAGGIAYPAHQYGKVIYEAVG